MSALVSLLNLSVASDTSAAAERRGVVVKTATGVSKTGV